MSRRQWQPSTWTVRVRILLTILLVAAFGMLATGAVTFFAQREEVLERIDHRLAATVTDVQRIASTMNSDTTVSANPSASASPSPSASASASASESADSAQSDPDLVTVQQVLRASLQRIIPDYHESVLGIINGRAALVPGVKVAFAIQDDEAFVARVVKETSGGKVVRGTADTSLGTLRYVAIPVTDGSSDDRGILVSAYNLNDEMESIAGSIRVFSIAAVVTLMVIAGVGTIVVGRLLRPIRQLQETAERITTSDLSQRIPVSGTDDVSSMANTVNEMLDRISQGMEDQRQLLNDVRHELRTPLTIVRGNLEVMDASDAKDVADTRDLVIDELDRMNSLVSDIALLSEASSTSKSGIASHDIAQFAAEVFGKAEALSRERQWSTEFAAEHEAEFDADRVTQAWLQLAENAVKYSDSGSNIVLGTSSETVAGHPGWRFYVRDEGIGIDPSMREQVFERFRRASQTRGVEGSGLGLSIVQAIANVHGGSAQIADNAGGGVTVSVALPLLAANSSAEQPTTQDTDKIDQQGD